MAVTKIKQGLMTLSILIVLSFFVFYAMDTFYTSPKWEDFCPQERGPRLTQTAEQCAAMDGEWIAQPTPCRDGAETCPQGYCDTYSKCKAAYDAVREPYERNVFVISMIIGLALLFTGLALKGASVSTGIMGGGVVIMFIGLAKYWGMLNKYFRLAILAVILALLIWVGYTKVDKMNESPRKPVKKSSSKKPRKRRRRR